MSSTIGNTSSIRFTGIASGIDTDSIIQKLMEIETQAVSRLQSQQATLATRQSAMLALKTQVTSLSVAAGQLNSATIFNGVTAASSDTDVATVSASSTAAAGSYSLAISKLAQAHKISSSAQANTTDSLGLAAGTFVVNGKGIDVDGTDTLTSLAQKINEAGAGVIASVIDGGSGNAFLTLTAASSGKAGAIQVADLSGSTVTSKLGWATAGTDAIREAITGGATSYGLSSSSTALSTVFGTTGVGSKTFNLNGTDISVDFDTQSLQDLASAINTSGSGATASVRSVVTDGVTTYKLDITGLTSQTDAGGALKALGVLQQTYTSEVVGAQDSTFTIDGLEMHTASNTVTSVIPGVTLTLLKANETTPEKATISLTRDTSSMKTKINDFVTAYNNVIGYIAANSSFDAETFESGTLFGDSTAQQVEAQLADMVLENVPGLTGNYTNLMSIGLSLDSDGKLAVDDTALTKALTSDPGSVGNLFRSVGSSSNSAITYVSSTSKSVATGTTPYSIQIDQAATQGAYTAAVAQTGASSAAESLTFDGSLFNGTDYVLYLEAGSTLTSTINKINSDGKLKNLVTATNDGGSLKITSKKYGTGGNFTVSSSLAAAADNSGIGIGAPGTSVTGVDVAGKINGEDAIGNGQFLLGKEGNATTSGLQIMYTGTATGTSVGTLSFTKGIGTAVNDLVGEWNDSTYGLFTSINDSLQTQYDGLTAQISDLQAAATEREDDLRTKFAAMEQALAQLQQQQSQLTALLSSSSKG